MDQKRRLTDFQRIVIYFSVIAAVFLAAMGLGWRNLWLLLAAGVLLVVAVGSVIIVGARHNAAGNEIITARVLSVSAPPPNTGISARCDMHLEVHLPGRAPTRMRHRDPSVSLTRWPQPGQSLPVEVRGGGAGTRRHLHVRWDLVELGMVRAPDGSQPPSSGGGASASQASVWEDEQEPIIYSPTPPRPRRPQAASAPPPSAPAPPPSAPQPPAPPPPVEVPAQTVGTGVFLHETYTNVDDETVRASSHPMVDQRDPARLAPNGHDPDGVDMADFETPHLAAPTGPTPPVTGGPEFESMTLPDFDPAEVDIRDFTDDPPAVTVMRPDDEPPSAAASAAPSTAPPATGTQPAPATAPPATAPPATAPLAGPRPASEAAPPQIPVPRDPGDTGPGGTASGSAASGSTASRGMPSGVTRPVADLARSLSFYRDALGFTVASAEGPVAVVESQGTRVRLTQSDGDPRSAPGEIHLDVTDIEATCEAAKEHAGEVVEAPAPIAGGVGRQRRRARLRDPDGHAIVIQSGDNSTG